MIRLKTWSNGPFGCLVTCHHLVKSHSTTVLTIENRIEKPSIRDRSSYKRTRCKTEPGHYRFPRLQGCIRKRLRKTRSMLPNTYSSMSAHQGRDCTLTLR